MPGSPAIRLLTTVGLKPGGTVRWGARIASSGPRVYVIETPEPLSEAPLDPEAIAAWTARVPNLRVHGQRPAPDALADRLRTCGRASASSTGPRLGIAGHTPAAIG